MIENRRSELASKRSLGTFNKSIFSEVGGDRLQTTGDTCKESEPMRTVSSFLKTTKRKEQIRQQNGRKRSSNEKGCLGSRRNSSRFINLKAKSHIVGRN